MKSHMAFALMTLALGLRAARAEHARIDLRVIRPAPEGGRPEEVTAHADQEPPRGGVNPRPLLKVKANEPLVLQFFLDNTYPHGEHKDVVVRYFVVRETKPRQKEVPDPAKGAVVQGRFKMNFKPKCRVGARVQFTIKTPGYYLLRVETDNTHMDHEHFSAIDVQVE